MPNQPKTPNRAVRVPEDAWKLYGLACEAEGTNRTADLNAHIQRKIKAYQRRVAEMPKAQSPASETAPA